MRYPLSGSLSLSSLILRESIHDLARTARQLNTNNRICSNGKIDKRALRQVAFAQLESAKMAAAAKASEKLALVKPEFYDTNLYSNCFSTPAIPPPVYQTEPSGSEKKLAFDQLAVTEKQVYPWDGYQEDEVPDKTQGKIVRNLRHQIFSLYRRLFGVVFVTNVAILIATFARPGGADAQHLGLIVVANLFCAILMRQDYVINTFFTVCCAVPSSCVFLKISN